MQYIPNAFIINSTDEFFSIVMSTSPNELMTSLDFKSLDTNIPLTEIIETCYNQPNFKHLEIPKHLLRKLLILCTSNAPFRNLNGKLFY